MNCIKLISKNALRGIQLVEVILCFALLWACTWMVFFQVLNRYWFHLRLLWLGDLMLLFLVAFNFLSPTVTTWKKDHISVDALSNRITKNKPVVKLIYDTSLVLVAVVIVCVFLPVVYSFMSVGLTYPEMSQLVPWFNISWLKVVLFTAFGLILLHLLVILVKDASDLIKVCRSGSRS